jgi:hypothetical protein
VQARLRRAPIEAARLERQLLAERSGAIVEALGSGAHPGDVAASLGVSRAEMYAMLEEGEPVTGTPEAPALSRDTPITLGAGWRGSAAATGPNTTWGALVDQGEALRSPVPDPGENMDLYRAAMGQKGWTVADALREQVILHDTNGLFNPHRLRGLGGGLAAFWHVVTAADVEAALGHGTLVDAA